MSEKKDNEYEKPISHTLGGDDLEDVDGGVNWTCTAGPRYHAMCQDGITAANCQSGQDTNDRSVCFNGGQTMEGACRTGGGARRRP